MVEMLNRQIELIFKYWDGEITEEEFKRCKLFSISEEVDKEAQIDRFIKFMLSYRHNGEKVR